ncbi:MAG: DUF503 domain-containing protein [Bdellovibrionales bacterium]|nr:DUF503 domain-containing protein [Bdellovibrionales bacterium]
MNFPVSLLLVELLLPEIHSLKGKRSIIRRIQHRLRTKFNVSVAEVANQDQWQSAVIAVCVVSSSNKVAQQTLQSVEKYVDEFHDVQVMQTRIEEL